MVSLKHKLEKKRSSAAFYLILITVLAIVFINIMAMKIEITRKQLELEAINDDLNAINIENEQLKRYCSNENRMDYIEQIARDQLDYSHSDETVYYFIPIN